MDTSKWKQDLTAAFPNLADEAFEILAPPSTRYNCVAYAAGDQTQNWDYEEDSYWPPWASRNDKQESMVDVFAGLSYQPCDDHRLEQHYVRIALYEKDGIAQHVALQMPNGRWRSKMGSGPLIEHHSPVSLSGRIYGAPTVFMRKATPVDS